MSPRPLAPLDNNSDMRMRCAANMSGVDPRFRIQTEPLDQEAQRVAEQQLRETPARVREATEQLRSLMREEGNLNFRDDDEILLIFLRPTKFYPESALALMKRVAQFKEKNSNILSELSSSSEREALQKSRVVNVLTDRDHLGRRILVANVGAAWDTNILSSDALFRLFYMIHLAAILEPETQVRGVVVILDFENLGMKQIAAMSPSFSYNLLTFIQEAMPLRLKEVHIVKEPFLFKVVWKLFKPLVKEKLRNRLYMHGSKMASLHKHLEPKCLPENYGGTLPMIDYSSADWYPALVAIEPHLREWNSFGYRRN
ncbi:clavesin-1-like [Macrosteles quadrilineatus]|uniref:clavesin-1-like n=1 Tax=Macrosteles quadrilineatus TaxID=74068 RepID=UPI0023E27FE9|nr:clavesin-1-like [Macrosteles quadrilineatus]